MPHIQIKPVLIVLSTFILLALSATIPLQALAATKTYSTVINGVKISYSKLGCNAQYDAADNTITISITEDFGNLAVTVTRDALFNNNDRNYVDIYISADAQQVNNISLRGYYNPSITPGVGGSIPIYLAGQVKQVKYLNLFYSAIGKTQAYPDMGLGTHIPPIKATLTNSLSYTPLGAYYYLNLPKTVSAYQTTYSTQDQAFGARLSTQDKQALTGSLLKLIQQNVQPRLSKEDMENE